MHCIKPTYPGFVYRRLRSTSDNDISLTQPNIVKGINHGICSRGAGRNCRKIWPMQTIAHRNMTRSYINKHFRDKERVETGCSVTFDKVCHSFCKSSQTTDTRHPNNAYPVSD